MFGGLMVPGLHAQQLYEGPANLLVPSSSIAEKDVSISAYKPQFQGVSEATIRIPGVDASAGYVLRVDLTTPGISFVATSRTSQDEIVSQTTEDFARDRHIQAAINANFFSPCCSVKPEKKQAAGLTISNGVVVSPPSTNGKYIDALLISKENRASIATISAHTDLGDVYTAVSGTEIVRDGKSIGQSSILNKAAVGNPRTLVGLSRDARYLYMVVVDGRQPGYSIGTTNTESATILLAIGAWSGLNLDGGGSTTMVMDKKGKVVTINRPSGKMDRMVAVSFGLHASPLQN